MKRFLTALGLGAAISLFWVSPVNAAPTPVQQSQVNSSIAGAVWNIPTDDVLTTHTVTVDVNQSKSGALLNYHDTTTRYEDSSHENRAHTEITKIELRSNGFTFTPQQRLKGATLLSNEQQPMPAITCFTDYVDNEPDRGGIVCDDTTVTMSVNWVGVGEISQDTTTSHTGPPIFPERIENGYKVTFGRGSRPKSIYVEPSLVWRA